ncbi:MAG: cytochrome c3 family protein [Anaeromyxobacteraceae bacterium]
MNRLQRLTLALAFAAAGCARYEAPRIAEKRPEIHVAHSAHDEGTASCTDCHEGIDKATSLAKSHRPTTEKCAECHEGDKDKIVEKWAPPPARLTFNHALHLSKVTGKNQTEKCGTCHKKLPDPGDEVAAPSMDTCTSCHNHQNDYAAGRCRPCHVDMKGLAPEKYFAHGGDWLRLHGAQARPTAESCAQCHDQTYCTACHSPQTAAARPSVIFPEAVDSSFIHRGDYVSRHAIEAGANPASCRRCHGPQYCDTCHTTANVSANAGASAFSPHPKGWATRGAGEKFHGDAARRDASSCAACHDQGAKSLCVGCHQVGAAGGNPHPKSWKLKAGDIASNAMCRTCHNK